MAEVKVIDAQDLDFAAFVTLQREAYSQIIAQTGTGYLFTESYYRWKYAPPSGRARIALVLDGPAVAANSMFPLTLRAGSATIAGWQSCDTATHPKARGKGYFMKCLGALRNSLEGEYIFFGFPNHNSMPGFIKFGWRHHSDVHTQVRVLPGRRTDAFRLVERINAFGSAHDEFATDVGSTGNTMVDRSSAYMNWRYFRHPLHEYESYAWVEGGRQLGLIVLRIVVVKNRRSAVAMELLSLTSRVERGLLRFAAAWARSKRVHLAMILNNTTSVGIGLSCGYVPVPMWALPKRQVLMGAAAGPTADHAWNETWTVQIGDWDGF